MKRKRYVFRTRQRLAPEQWRKRHHTTAEERAETIRLVDEALASPETQARIDYFLQNGYLPEEKEDRDELIARGYGEAAANELARRENLLRNGFEVNDGWYE